MFFLMPNPSTKITPCCIVPGAPPSISGLSSARNVGACPLIFQVKKCPTRPTIRVPSESEVSTQVPKPVEERPLTATALDPFCRRDYFDVPLPVRPLETNALLPCTNCRLRTVAISPMEPLLLPFDVSLPGIEAVADLLPSR